MMLTPLSTFSRRSLQSLQQIPCCSRCLSSGGASLSQKLQYSPSQNDITKLLSNRDKRFFRHIKKVRSLYSSSALKDLPVLTKGFYPTDITNQGVYMGTTFFEHPPQPLPQLDASAILDPKGYCRASAAATTTISGSDAARRLIRGKKYLMETMRQEIEEQKEVKKLYVLKGHGVPEQLFHHLLDAAQKWTSVDVLELSVQNVFGALLFDRMFVRTEDGATRTNSWPSKWEDDMELYLTVMSRMANHMSNVFLLEDGVSQPRLKQWNISVKRDHALPPKLLPDDATTHPVIEFVPMEGSIGGISIRLQNDKASMMFESVFDTKNEVRGRNSLL